MFKGQDDLDVRNLRPCEVTAMLLPELSLLSQPKDLWARLRLSRLN